LFIASLSLQQLFGAGVQNFWVVCASATGAVRLPSSTPYYRHFRSRSLTSVLQLAIFDAENSPFLKRQLAIFDAECPLIFHNGRQ
jgi:hypothetical protein